jgi:SAM-dependent methyltransferase
MSTVGTTNEDVRLAWVKQALGSIKPGARILDAGAGEQRFRPFCAHLRHVAQDFAQYDGVGDGLGLQTGTWNQDGLDIISDIIRVPEPDGSFDAILCTEVLEHHPAPILALREFARLLAPGGQLLLTAPFCCLTHFAPHFYYTGFSRYFYETHLTELGFKVDELTANGNYFEYLAQELWRLRQVAERDAGCRTRLWERVALRLVIRLLARCSARDRGSQLLLHFGHQVRATRL